MLNTTQKPGNSRKVHYCVMFKSNTFRIFKINFSTNITQPLQTILIKSTFLFGKNFKFYDTIAYTKLN